VTALDEVAAAVGRGSRTVVEIRDALRAVGRVSITTADVQRVLGTHPHRFRSDAQEPPRWWPAAASESEAARVLPVRGEVAGLYRWQAEALDAWRSNGGRGVVEAVTGTGKTMVGIAAATEELARGGQVLVLVPTRELLDQWTVELARRGPAHARIGRLGGGCRDDLGACDVLVAVVNSAREADLRPRRPGGLLVADECHRYGSDGNRVALAEGFVRRLGLSATYARADEAHLTWLDPYFGGTCFRMGYRRAIRDGVTARFTVALLGVEFTRVERDAYGELSLIMSAAQAQLVASEKVPADPIGAFFAGVARLARGDDSPLTWAARAYLNALQQRRRLLAESPAKSTALESLVPALLGCDRAIAFTQSIAAAENAATRLRNSGVRAEAIHSQLGPAERRCVLTRFGAGSLQVVTAPQVLDEGVDVPAADLAVILAASRSRRQMIQRMGRVLRRKPDGRSARLVIVFVRGTVEDPAFGAHEGFLEEITPVADAVQTFPPGGPDELCRYLRPQGA
jgi:superfamily II DNA or RNA helicase